MLPHVRILRFRGYSLDFCPDAPWSRRWCVWRHASEGPLREDGTAWMEAKPVASAPWRWLLVLGYGHLLRSLPLTLPELP